MSIIIRKAKISDSEALSEFAENIFRETFSIGSSAADMDAHCLKDFYPSKQEQEILDANMITFIAEANKTIIGFAQLRLDSPIESIKSNRVSELSRLYLSTEQHGKGLAHKIIKAVFHSAANSKCNDMWLGVWENNFKAITFYKKYGFEVIGEHIFQLGSDPQKDLIMGVNLRAL